MSFKEGDRVVIMSETYTEQGLPVKGTTGTVVRSTDPIDRCVYLKADPPSRAMFNHLAGEVEGAWVFFSDELLLLEEQPTTGLRFNSGKLPYHLLPDDAIQEVVRVLQKGAEKYAERNWQNGLKWDSECASSLQRHLAAWKLGEDNDAESGLPHMAHVATNALFLLHFAINGTGEDDRYAYKQS